MGHQRVAEPVVRPRASTRILLSGLSIARTVKAARSSSGAKQTAMVPFDAVDKAGNAGEKLPRVSDGAKKNTQKLCYRSINSLLPCSRAHQIGEVRDRIVHCCGRTPALVVAAIEPDTGTESFAPVPA